MMEGNSGQELAEQAVDASLAVTGMGPLASDHTLHVALGETVILGRSRSCNWSLRETPRYVGCTGRERAAINTDLAFSTVSRHHTKINYVAEGLVEITNLSGNGTLVDGKPVDKLVLTDCHQRAHHIRLGPRGVTVRLQPNPS